MCILAHMWSFVLSKKRSKVNFTWQKKSKAFIVYLLAWRIHRWFPVAEAFSDRLEAGLLLFLKSFRKPSRIAPRGRVLGLTWLVPGFAYVITLVWRRTSARVRKLSP